MTVPGQNQAEHAANTTQTGVGQAGSGGICDTSSGFVGKPTKSKNGSGCHRQARLTYKDFWLLALVYAWLGAIKFTLFSVSVWDLNATALNPTLANALNMRFDELQGISHVC
jgi:hypothetical protein